MGIPSHDVRGIAVVKVWTGIKPLNPDPTGHIHTIQE